MTEQTSGPGVVSDDPPVTVLVTRRPLPGKEREFEDYLTGITQAANNQPGHLGSTIFRPSSPKDPAYRVLFKFDRRSNLDRWENSAERAEWHAIAEQVSQPRETQIVCGMEAWFTAPAQPVNLPPPKYKMALVVWLAIFVLVTSLNAVLTPFIAHWPLIARTFLLSIIVVPLMTWVVMPFLTRLFSGWLFSHRD
jgi:antibiotic biosynthesis monooxygenase (ABM) superfamily enzyme